MAGSNVFVGGKGLFTSSDPMSALRAKPPPTWSAVMPQYLTPEVANAYKQAGVALVIWEPSPSQAGVDAVNQYGAAGYIAQAEGPDQLAAANQVSSQINVPKALVTNNFMDSYPPGWIAMPEAYQNNDPGQTPDQMVRDAQARGAQVVVPVIGLGFVDTPDGRRMSAAEYQAGLDAAGQAGAVGSAAYLSDQASDEDLAAYTSGQTPRGTPPTGTQPPGQPPKPVTPAPLPPPSGTRPPETPNPLAPPPPPYQRPGSQYQEGPLGENWNLGWQNTPAPPYSLGGGQRLPLEGGLVRPNPVVKPPEAPPTPEPPPPTMPYLDAAAIHRFLGGPAVAQLPPPPPPYFRNLGL